MRSQPSNSTPPSGRKYGKTDSYFARGQNSQETALLLLGLAEEESATFLHLYLSPSFVFFKPRYFQQKLTTGEEEIYFHLLFCQSISDQWPRRVC